MVRALRATNAKPERNRRAVLLTCAYLAWRIRGAPPARSCACTACLDTACLEVLTPKDARHATMTAPSEISIRQQMPPRVATTSPVTRGPTTATATIRTTYASLVRQENTLHQQIFFPASLAPVGQSNLRSVHRDALSARLGSTTTRSLKCALRVPREASNAPWAKRRAHHAHLEPTTMDQTTAFNVLRAA